MNPARAANEILSSSGVSATCCGAAAARLLGAAAPVEGSFEGPAADKPCFRVGLEGMACGASLADAVTAVAGAVVPVAAVPASLGAFTPAFSLLAFDCSELEHEV